jgi:hypothetical protein
MTPTSKGTLHVAARGIADGGRRRTGQCPMGRLDRGRIDLGGIDASRVESLAARSASSAAPGSGPTTDGSATACGMASGVGPGSGRAMDGSPTACGMASGVASRSGSSTDGSSTTCGMASGGVAPSSGGAADPRRVSSRRASSCSSFCSKGSRSISRNSSTSPSHVSAAPISTNVSARALRSSLFFSLASGLQDRDALSYSWCSPRRRAVSRAISSRPRNARCFWPLVGSSRSANRDGGELSDIALSPVSNVSPGGVGGQAGELACASVRVRGMAVPLSALAGSSTTADQGRQACTTIEDTAASVSGRAALDSRLRAAHGRA